MHKKKIILLAFFFLIFIMVSIVNPTWYKLPYANKRNISFDYYGMGSNMPFLLNGTNNATIGFNFNDTNTLNNQYVWGLAPDTSNMSIYYNDNSDYVLVYNNETSQAPMEVEYGNSTSFNPSDVWDKNYLLVVHFERLNSTSNGYIDSSFYNRSSANALINYTNGTNTGKFGRAYYQQDSGPSVVAFVAPDLEFNTGIFTIEAWLKNVDNDDTPQKSIFARRGAGDTYWLNLQYYPSDNTMHIGNTGTDRIVNLTLLGIPKHPLGVWRYWALTKQDNGTIKLYLDGRDIATVADFAFSNITGPVCIGATSEPQCSTQTLLQGYAIDEFRFSNITRNETFIRANFNSMSSKFALNQTNTELDTTSPNITLVVPLNNSQHTTNAITFSCNVTDETALSNISLFTDFTGSWASNKTNTVSGASNIASFIVIDIPKGTFIWNCLATDKSNNKAYAPNNFTIGINQDSSLPSGGGGGGPSGGGGIAPVRTEKEEFECNKSKWRLKPSFFETFYLKEGKRALFFEIINYGEKDLELSLKCEDTTENATANICNYVKISEKAVTVKPNALQPQLINFTVEVPPNATFGDKFFFYISVNDKTECNFLVYSSNTISYLGIFSKLVTTIGFIIFLAIFAISILVSILIYAFLKNGLLLFVLIFLSLFLALLGVYAL